MSDLAIVALSILAVAAVTLLGLWLARNLGDW